MAMADAANQVAWYWNFLVELGYSVDNSILLHGNNKGAIDLVLNVTPYGSILPIDMGL